MIDINPEEVMDWNTTKLWNTLQTLRADEDSSISIEEYEQVKEGVRIKVPIWYITQEWYELYPSSKKMLILGFGKFRISDFMNEKDERDRIMRRLILENLPEGVTAPRT